MSRISGALLVAVGLTAIAGLSCVAATTPTGGAVAIDEAGVSAADRTSLSVDRTTSQAANETTASSPNGTSPPELTAAYPNPTAYGDEGEYLVLEAPNGTELGAYRLDDGHREARLPDRTVGGRIVLTANRSAVPDGVRGPIVEWSEMVPLSNAGESLTLSDGNGTVETLEYEDAPEGEVLRPDTDRRWRALGATSFEPVVGGPGSVRAFALPDSPSVPLAVIESAERRVLLAGYTFTSERVAERLIAVRERGVAVEVIVDGAPVGGLTERSAAVLDRLTAANVSVRVVGGDGGRYEFQHAKYAVVDDRAIVLTENWKPAGVGGASSRGWGVVVDSPAIVDGLSRTFRADSGSRGAVPWEAFRGDVSLESAAPSRRQYPARIESQSVAVERAELVVAPDNAAGRVQGLLANASDSVRIVQVSIGGRDDRLLREAIAAAERGVEVRILLSGAWYVEEENRRLVDQLRTLSAREDLPLSVRLAEPGGRYEKIHAKGVVIDGETVVLGSLNWNDNAYDDNREVAVVLHGTEAGAYFRKVFERDWRGGITLVPAGTVLTLVAVVLPVARLGRRVEFASQPGTEREVPGARID
ncbi:Phosphatidylserine/phosphatidylglycerophosphate/ cardiolipin synthase or related enzyme [Halapricum desulfuricans]|uniref:Phosphatidylserine/phosphatidylglycerophosphate/ cardiolipin synthase or related enzyme n=1 Tax=Halapricum desulfuricans TaxID=2841257 RepID=A0A897NQF1_9EURY|nr:phospholipase D-like domain-containing protein [Halapricum desulfuricans]QSG12426.1 Phosphatidylserine/phosphatidylglycerophosphate/ cardiolipin synthase or related enzyme [Halapricum desulfuricans]